MRSRYISIDLEGVDARIFYHGFRGVPVKTLVVSFSNPREVLSTREGFKKVETVCNNYTPEELWDFVHKKPGVYEDEIVSSLSLSDKITLLSTGVDVDNLSLKTERFDWLSVYAIVTAGIRYNAMRVGVDKAGCIEKDGRFEDLKTVNTIILTNASLSKGAMARAIITATEAKVIAMEDLRIKSSYSDEQATGTGTDNMVIVSGDGPRINYTGNHSKAGEIVAKAVTSATKDAIYKQDGIA